MKLLLLHGPAVSSSRAKLVSLKKEQGSQETVVFGDFGKSGDGVDKIMGELLTVGLLSKERLVVLENPPEDLELSQIVNIEGLSLILWFDRELSPKKKLLEWAGKNGKVLFFPEAKEVSVFPLLDLLATGEHSAFVQIDKLKTAGFDIYYFITMTFYLLRSLVTPPASTPPFIKNKLSKQRSRFSVEDLTNLYRQVLEIEYKLKSGLLEPNQAEFLLVSRFLFLP